MLTFRHKQPTTCLGLVLFALFALGFFAQPTFAAENCTAPPGTSGLDQYCESLPGAGGTNSHHHGGGGGGGAKHVSNTTSKALKSKGADGAAVLSLAQTGSATVPAQTTPRAAAKKKAALHHRAKHHKQAASTPQTPATAQHVAAGPPAPAAPSNNPLSAVGSAVGGNSGYTWAIIGLGALLAALAVGARRRSGGEAAPEPPSA